MLILKKNIFVQPIFILYFFLFCLFSVCKTYANDTIPAPLKNYVPAIHDTLIIDRLNCLQKAIPLSYHPTIKKLLERYLVKQRGQVQIFLSRKDRYFPVFEETLAKHGMPDELKYLAVVESALIPRIQSWASAVGLWQFMPATGRQYGLHQDIYIDERMDPHESTEAACKHLKYLYKMFGDWHLALAAYNCGEGNILRAIKRSGGKRTFWEIYNYLPNETRGYVPMFISIMYVMNYYDQHFIEEPIDALHFIHSDTIQVNKGLNLVEFSKQIDVPLETMQALNPHLKKNIVPHYLKNYPVRFPKEKTEMIALRKDTILFASRKNTAVPAVPYTQDEIARANQLIKIRANNKFTHNVKFGESLALLCKRYNVTPTDVMVWNKLNSQTIYNNQKIVMWLDDEKIALFQPKKSVFQNASYQAPAQIAGNAPEIKTDIKKEVKKTENNKNETSKNTTETIQSVHIVQSGDTLWKITQQYKGLTTDKIKKLNPDLKNDNLTIGQKIRIM
jgi:membrane-bound lytic murein transglycosylase D